MNVPLMIDHLCFRYATSLKAKDIQKNAYAL